MPLHHWSLARGAAIISRRYYANFIDYPSESASSSEWHAWFASRLSTWPTTAVSCPTALGALSVVADVSTCVVPRTLSSYGDRAYAAAEHRLGVWNSLQFSCVILTSPMDCSDDSWMYFLHLSLSSVILTDSSTESPVHVLMLSIRAVRGLPRLRVHLHTAVKSWIRLVPNHSILASLLWRCLKVPSYIPALLRTHSFVFFAVHDTRRLCLPVSFVGTTLP